MYPNLTLTRTNASIQGEGKINTFIESFLSLLIFFISRSENISCQPTSKKVRFSGNTVVTECSSDTPEKLDPPKAEVHSQSSNSALSKVGIEVDLVGACSCSEFRMRLVIVH